MEKATEWCEVIHALNCIDVLRSFAVIGHSSRGSMSRPIILPQSSNSTSSPEKQGPVLQINGLWHPYALVENGESPVPNDMILGPDKDGYHPHTLLLTGPNMGGKSTLLRSTCLAVILAQVCSKFRYHSGKIFLKIKLIILWKDENHEHFLKLKKKKTKIKGL